MRLTTFLILASTACAYPGTHALLMGVQDYTDPSINLEGVYNDIALIRHYLERKDPTATIEVLIDSQATHTGIVHALVRLQRVSPTDVVFIYWSGHGSQTMDLNGDERSDGRDETWVCFGARSGRTGIDDFDLLDDELDHYLAQIPTNKLIVISDSCHSGSFSRAELSRTLALDKREHPLGRKFSVGRGFKGVRLGAASERERAIEIRTPQNKAQGAFTLHLVRALDQARSFDSWNDILDRARATMVIERIRQRPTLEGQGTLTRDFESAPVRFLRAVLGARREDGKWPIKIGKLMGVERGCHFRIGSEGSRTELEIVEAGFLQSLATLRSGPKPSAGDVATLTLLRTPTRIPAAVSANVDPAVALDIQTQLNLHYPDNFDWVPQATAQWLFQLNLDSASILELSVTEQRIGTAWRLGTWPVEDFEQDLAPPLNAIFRRDVLLKLQGSGKGLACTPLFLKRGPTEIVDGLTLEHPKLGQFGQYQPPSPTTLPRDAACVLKITNLALQQRYLYIVSMDSHGRVGLIFPGLSLQPEEALLSIRQTKLLDSAAVLFRNPGHEYLLLISSAWPLDPEALIDPNFDEREEADRSGIGGGLEDWDALTLHFEITP